MSVSHKSKIVITGFVTVTPFWDPRLDFKLHFLVLKLSVSTMTGMRGTGIHTRRIPYSSNPIQWHLLIQMNDCFIVLLISFCALNLFVTMAIWILFRFLNLQRKSKLRGIIASLSEECILRILTELEVFNQFSYQLTIPGNLMIKVFSIRHIWIKVLAWFSFQQIRNALFYQVLQFWKLKWFFPELGLAIYR